MHYKKLIKRVRIPEMDTVKSRQKVVGKERDVMLFGRIEQLWESMGDFREQGARAVNFAYGDQWADIIEVNGVKMTQRQYLQQTGNFVIQTNQIKNKIDTIVGVMVKEQNEPVCNARDREEQQYGEVLTNALQANCDLNLMISLYMKWLKDLCTYGIAVSAEAYEYRKGRLDTWTDYCDPNSLFMDCNLVDPRFWDISTIGRFYDLTKDQLCARFVKKEEDYTALKAIYAPQFEHFQATITNDFRDREEEKRLVFRTPEDPSRCRVFEVWTKESRARYRLHDYNEGTVEVIDATDAAALREVELQNQIRLEAAKGAGWTKEDTPLIEKEFFIDEFWYCRFLAPDGTIIWEDESPYPDGMHPFTLCATPLVAGQIRGYLNDAIDHNIAMNRVVVLQDWLARTQAKGVTVVPKKIVPGQDFKKFAKSWTSIDEMVFIDLKEGEEGLMPKVFYGNAQTYNAAELVNMYKNLMDNSTSVNGALQGKTPYSGTSGTLYAQMVANSSTPIAALLTQFHTFMQELQTKKMKNIAKFYEKERLEIIAGNMDTVFDNANMHLEDIAFMEMDVTIRESTDTGVYRAIINDDAKEFLMAGLITFEEYLEIAKVPYADKILQSRQARQAEAEQAGGLNQQQAQAMAQQGGEQGIPQRTALQMGMPLQQ